MTRRLGLFGWTSLILGFVFLYAPVALLVVYSFNASRLVTVWGGFSTRWYASVFENRQLIESAWTSLRVALTSAALATLLGVAAAMALARFGRFRGRLAFAALLYAPLVMPEIVLGLALLLTFVALDFERGYWTIVAAHTTLSMCFVAVIVLARLRRLDGSLEEAAADLGAGPGATFVLVTLPAIAPSAVAGFLLAFTISMDDFVLASFTSGPGSTTLPMRIYSAVRLGVTPEVNALSTLLLGSVGLVAAMTFLALRRRLVD